MRAALLVLVAAVFAACAQDAGEPSSPAIDAGPAADAGSRPVVYSYVDEHGRVRMASSKEDVPLRYRDKVVSTDTSASRAERLRTDRVLVVDLRKEGNFSVVDLDRLGRSTARPRPRDPGQLGRWVVGEGAAGVRRLLGLATEATSGRRVLLYTAPWCGFCKKAAAHLRARGVPFVERDVDNDRTAAIELAGKLKKAGLTGGGVPVLDIGGTIVIGFDKARIDKLIDGL